MIKYNSGQALIIIVLVIALVLTVITASSYQLTVQTEGAKLQEESVRALAAADAGIEVGLRIANTDASPQSYTFASQGLNLPGIDPAKSEIYVTDTSSSEFVSSMVLKDDQFTFYTRQPPTFPSPGYAGNLDMYFASEGSGSCNASRTTPALELTFIYGANNNIDRRVVEPCTSGVVISGNSFIGTTAVSQAIQGTTFSYKIDTINTASYPQLKMIIVRSLFSNTRVAFVAQTGTFTNQGKQIEARTYSISGPSKIVTVFQSLPQLPADFFVTSF